METMTSRERVLRALRGKPVDRLTWAPLVDHYYTSSLKAQGLPEMSVVETLRYIGADIIERHVPGVRSQTTNVKVKKEQKGDDIYLIFETPVGTAYEVTRAHENTSFKAKHLVETEQDAKVYQYVVEHTKLSADYERFVAEDKLIGDDGIATVTGPVTPIQTLLQQIMGVEGTVYGLIDFPETMIELMATMHEKYKEYYTLHAESPAEVVIDYEDTSSTVMSPDMYEKHCRQYIDDYADIIHSSGKIFITHMCGKLKAFGKQIAAGRMDGIDSVCPPTTGDTWPHEAFELFGMDKVIIGGLEPPALVRMTETETVEYVKKVLAQVPEGAPLILSTGDATSHGTPIANLIAITRYIKEQL